jgi:AcrR family transcriptional regulator
MDPTSTKSRVLEAATQVFLRQGFAATSMDQVRQEAGVSNGSLYHHYPTKAQLADALYAHTLRDFHATLMKAIHGRATAQSGVKGLVRNYIQWVVDNPLSARLLHELRRSGGLADAGQWTTANAEGFEVLAVWLRQKVDAGEMRDLAFPVWTAVVFAPAISLTPHWARQPKPEVAPKVRAALEHAAWMAVAP